MEVALRTFMSPERGRDEVDAAQRITTPSPSRKTPSPSKCELLNVFPTPIPKFILDVIGDENAEGNAIVNPHFLPDFEFRPRDPTTQQLSDIRTYFPGCTGVFFVAPFLTIIWPKLPSRPWPLTVGGLPLFYTTSGNFSTTPTFGRPARGISIREDTVLKPWETPTTSLLMSVAKELTALKINFLMLAWCGPRFYVELDCLSVADLVPCTICHLPVVWKFKEHVQSARHIQPSPGDGDIVDCSPYEGELRPGVYLTSSCRTRSTTSGLPLAKDGESFITVASHGFPETNGVHTTSCAIGLIERRYPEADVGLVKLFGGISYSDVTFDGNTKGTRIHSMVVADEVSVPQKVFLDSPFNGKCHGLVVAKGVSAEVKAHLEHGDVNAAEYQYVTIHVLYFGNGMAKDIQPGTCGASIWDEEGNAIGFFRFYDTEDGVAYAPATDILVENGYVISPIKS